MVQNELNSLSNDQLIKLASQEGIRKTKSSKTLDRVRLIELLMDLAKSRLNQGASFNQPLSLDSEINRTQIL